MAIRKETVKQQFTEALPSVLEPGEQPAAGVYVVSGPSPWLSTGLLGLVGMLIFGVRWYYLAVTDHRVVFMKASMMTGRPQGLAWADPRSAASVSDVDLSATVWGKLMYHRPDGKVIRLNVHRFWLDEGRAAVQALGGPPAPQQQPSE